MSKILLPLICIGLLSIISCNQEDQSRRVPDAVKQERTYQYPFFNPELAVEQRIDNLVSRLTLQEKASMMLYNSPAIARLGIPEYNWWNECLHGVARAGKATVFPQAIGLAATWDTDLMKRVGEAISHEARAKYNASVKRGYRGQYAGLTFWTPNINIFRDPRWGRGQETYGEDPYLSGILGIAFVRGLQGDHPKYLKAAACAKHFAVHSGPEKIRHEFNALPSEVDFRETYLPAFKMLVDAEVEAVMCAYNRTYYQPCCGSPYLLNDILRKSWGFKGHIVSDCWALDDIFARHKVAEDEVEAAAMAARAGVNLNCGYVYKYLPQAVADGLIDETLIDSLLATLLKTRFRLGLFDPEEMVPYSSIGPEVINCREHRELAYEAAAKSMVLLKNDDVLPLNREKTGNLLIVGPTSADIKSLLGNYNGFSGQMSTILEGVVEAAEPGTIIEHNTGFLFHNDTMFHGFWQAGRADAVLVCIGINALFEGEENDALLNPHGGDRRDIRLPANQVEYVRLMREAIGNKPLIVILTGGSALAMPELNDLADAILFAWYPGEAGGRAVAGILFGDINPSGRLPVTFYKSNDDLPAFDEYSMENRTYKYFTGEPLYAFGHGLSYTDFSYSDAEVEEQELTVTLENAGKLSGHEVVQVYVRKANNKYPEPIKELMGFNRIFLEPGDKASLTIQLDWNILNYWNQEKQSFDRESGIYQLLIGPSSEDIRLIHEMTI